MFLKLLHSANSIREKLGMTVRARLHTETATRLRPRSQMGCKAIWE